MLTRLLTAVLLLGLLAGPASAQITPMPVPVPTFFGADGLACALCTLETYEAGTATPLATYQDASAMTLHQNPVQLNAVGRPNTGTPIYLLPTAYKFILKSAAGATIWTADNVLSVPTAVTGLSNATDLTLQVDSDNNGSNKFSFLNGTTIEKANINESGDLQLDGIATIDGGQVVFPSTQIPAAGANTLDDYEEGSWTPVIGGSGGTSGQSYTSQVGRYVKIGKLVICQFLVVLSAKGTITTNVQIQGLPFTSESVSGLTSVAALRFSSLATNWIHVIARVTSNGTTADVMGNGAAGQSNSTALVTADIQNVTELEGTLIYRAAN